MFPSRVDIQFVNKRHNKNTEHSRRERPQPQSFKHTTTVSAQAAVNKTTNKTLTELHGSVGEHITDIFTNTDIELSYQRPCS